MPSPAGDHVHVYVVEGTVLDPTTGDLVTAAKCSGCSAVKTRHEPRDAASPPD